MSVIAISYNQYDKKFYQGEWVTPYSYSLIFYSDHVQNCFKPLQKSEGSLELLATCKIRGKTIIANVCFINFISVNTVLPGSGSVNGNLRFSGKLTVFQRDTKFFLLESIGCSSLMYSSSSKNRIVLDFIIQLHITFQYQSHVL